MTTPPTPYGRAVEPADWRRHTMGESLRAYLDLKIHHLIRDHEWDAIRVIGDYDRSCVVSSSEKVGKPFNWQRPTAQPAGRDLVLKCFPGTDYVEHYGLIVATYLEMTGRYRGQVHAIPPSESVCGKAVDALALDLTTADLVVLGWGLPRLAGEDGWTEGRGFAHKRVRAGGIDVVYLGYLHSIWGDVAGRVVARLAELGARRALYIGKVGGLSPDHVPNTILATGRQSLVRSREVSWTDIFDDETHAHPLVTPGVHVTSPSILLETQPWLARHHGYSFVDPEIGPMGAAACEAGIEFGYMHVVSNNLAKVHDADLSNERQAAVVDARTRLLDAIAVIVDHQVRRTLTGSGACTEGSDVGVG